MAVASPFFKDFELAKRVELVVPEVQHGTPLDSGGAAVAYQSLERTALELGNDGAAYRRLLEPLLNRVDGIVDFTSYQLLRVPRDPLAAVQLGLATLDQGSPLWNRRFREDAAPALLTGVMAHAVSALPALTATGAGLMLAVLAHAGGWVIPVGGSASIAQAMADDVLAHGGTIHTGQAVESLDQVRGTGQVPARLGSIPFRECRLQSGLHSFRTRSLARCCPGEGRNGPRGRIQDRNG
jgi:phytoene dehydrogenase-like protein